VTLDGLGYSAAIALAMLLLLSATAKLVTPRETERSFVALGVPNAATAARFVPLPELAAAVLLAVVPAVGGVAVLMLLAFFTTFVVSRLRAGTVAPCACFGAASNQPLSWLTLARNAALGLLAVLSLATSRPVRPTLPDVVAVLVYVVVVAMALQVGDRLTSTGRST
jgi:hypothetical protein